MDFDPPLPIDAAKQGCQGASSETAAEPREAADAAIKADDAEGLRSALLAGLPVDWPDPRQAGSTPLMKAAWEGSARCVALLLDAGAQALARNGHDASPLSLAAGFQRAECARMLADAARGSRRGRSMASKAAAEAAFNSDWPTLQALAPACDSLSLALRVATKGEWQAGVESILAQRGSAGGPKCSRLGLRESLRRAAHGGAPEIVARLALEIKSRDAGWQAILSHELERAAGRSWFWQCRALLSAGADALWRNPHSGRSALMGAAANGHAELAALLLPASDATAVDRQGLSAAELALQNGNASIQALILAAWPEHEARALRRELDSHRADPRLDAKPSMRL